MKLFEPLYDRVLQWSRHRHATRYLAAMSFAESSFFPLPPDVMLMPMVAARPREVWQLATLTTLFSVLGGAFGYALGLIAMDLLAVWSWSPVQTPAWGQAVEWFAHWGVWVVLLAGFSPLPYKVFTVAAGALGMPFLPFLLASLVGRGSRFFVVAGLMAWLGPLADRHLRPYMERLGWLVVVLAGGILLFLTLWDP